MASVWRRQTFSAAVETFTAEMSQLILDEHMPNLTHLLNLHPAKEPVSNKSQSSITGVLGAAYDFSRMLHGSASSAGGTVDAFYRAFVPELASTLYPRQIELVKRCLTSERGEIDRVGATIFPGLVKVSKGPATPNEKPDMKNVVQTVVRRAQVVCECALIGGLLPGGANGSVMSSPSPPGSNTPNPTPHPPSVHSTVSRPPPFQE